MANKQRKKRNKQYQGANARVTTPMVTRVSAVERNRFQEWWLQYGKITRAISIILGIIGAMILTIIGIIGIVT